MINTFYYISNLKCDFTDILYSELSQEEIGCYTKYVEDMANRNDVQDDIDLFSDPKPFMCDVKLSKYMFDELYDENGNLDEFLAIRILGFYSIINIWDNLKLVLSVKKLFYILKQVVNYLFLKYKTNELKPFNKIGEGLALINRIVKKYNK